MSVDAEHWNEDAHRDQRSVVRPARDRLEQVVPSVSNIPKESRQLVQLEVEPGWLPGRPALHGEVAGQVLIEGAGRADVATAVALAHWEITSRSDVLTRQRARPAAQDVALRGA